MEELNSEQQAVVEAGVKPNLCVIAGAGSGKTGVLVARAVRLLKSGNAPLLMLTFSRAAADEIRLRIQRSAPQADHTSVKACTFHAIALRVLRSCEGQALQQATGRTDNFGVFGPQEQQEIAFQVLQEIGGKKNCSPEMLLRSVARARRLNAEAKAGVGAHAGKRPSPAEMYEERLTACNAFDLDGLVSAATLVLRSNQELRDRWHASYRAVMVDEFQDSSRSNLDLLLVLCGPETAVMVVGDDDQSIYSFRGAEPGIFDAFERSFPGDVRRFHLSRNYRSSGNIVAAAEGVVRGVQDRVPKVLQTENPEGENVLVGHCIDATIEVNFLAHQIQQLAGRGIPLGEVAILLRTRALCLDVRARLEDQGIPTAFSSRKRSRHTGGRSAVDAQDHRTVGSASAALALVRLVSNESDRASFAVLVAVFQVKQEIVQKVTAQTGASVLGTARQLHRTDRAAKVHLFKLLLAVDRVAQNFRRAAPDVSLRRLLFFALTQIPDADLTSGDAEQMLSAAQEADAACSQAADSASAEAPAPVKPTDSKEHLADEDDMLTVLKKCRGRASPTTTRRTAANLTELSRNAHSKLRARLETYALLERETDVTASKPVRNAVLCATIHQSKGLEWRAVLLPRLNEEVLPLGQERSTEQVDEERRLCYVACSRARDVLILSYLAVHESAAALPSRFLADLPSPRTRRLSVQERVPIDPVGAARASPQARSSRKRSAQPVS